MNEHHPIKQFLRPVEGEYVPITFIDFVRKLVGWSTELKRSVYIEKEEDKASLKRIREANILIAINHLSGNVSSIELTDEEKRQFEEVYSLYLEKGGQLVYTRKKIGARKVSCFEIHETWREAVDASPKAQLSEKL